jgi:hypothetical protein
LFFCFSAPGHKRIGYINIIFLIYELEKTKSKKYELLLYINVL